MIEDTFIVSIVTFVYFFAALAYLVAFIFRRQFIEKIALTTVSGGLVLHTAAVIIRWVNSYHMGIGHAPLSNFYESLVFFSWALAFIYLVARRRISTTLLGSVASFFAFLILAYASLSGNVSCEIQPLIPALQSNWLISHVISSFLAYACFAIAFGSGILYLVRDKTPKQRLALLPDAGVLDEITYQMISIGFVL